MKRLTKLQSEFIDEGTTKGSIIAFRLDVFKSTKYKEWKKNKRSSRKPFRVGTI